MCRILKNLMKLENFFVEKIIEGSLQRGLIHYSKIKI